ncbi:hypothetical protein [Ruegeria arenilitoris]|uniref:hypothetical protein n=1 Tax=Ruegeria arenilitoris TaxID=1173585 RepID=UPI00147CDECE|nr:hypothetical protein [Ruegeria arenilitoris]
MIVALYIIPLLMLIPILWIMTRAFLHFERSKKAVVDGIAMLGADRLSLLGWKAGPYVSMWKTLPFPGSDWQLNSQRFHNQMHGLQRVALYGLPASEEMDASVRKSARTFRIYFWIIGFPGFSLVYLAGSAKICIWLGGATSTPPVYWFAATLAIVTIGFITPFDKYRKWPNVEVMK